MQCTENRITLAIYGTGGAGKERLQIALEIEKMFSRWKEILFIDDTKPIGTVYGYHCYPYEEFKKLYPITCAKIHVAVGEPSSKKSLIEKVKSDGYQLESIIHPHAYVADSVQCSEGIYIKMGAVIKDHVAIGMGACIQSHAIIRENCIVDCFSQISEKAVVGREVHISEGTFVGMHAVVDDGLSVGKFAIVSMGATVFNDLQDEAICMGNPGRIMGKNVSHKIFCRRGTT